MGVGSQQHLKKKSDFLKGLHVGNGDYVNNIDGMLWGEASGGYTHTEVEDCTGKFNNKKGLCICPRNTWLRGEAFTNNNAKKYLSGWIRNYCNHMNGYFHDKCVTVPMKGKNKWGTCPVGKYIVGIQRGADKKGAIGSASLYCCGLDYHDPYRGYRKLPERYYTIDKKNVAFRTADKLMYVNS